MENQEFLRQYIYPLTTVMEVKKKTKPIEYKAYIERISSFYNANSGLNSEDFQRKVLETFKHEAMAAIHYTMSQNKQYTRAIHGYVSYFFWLSIASAVIAIIALLSSIN